MYIGLHVKYPSCKAPFILVRFQLNFLRHFFEKPSKIKFHENSSSVSRVVTKLIVAFRNFAKAPKQVTLNR